MFEWLKMKKQWLFDTLLGYLGYFRPEVNNAVIHQVWDDYLTEVNLTEGLKDSIAYLSARHNDNNIIITALTMMQGSDSVVLEHAYLKDITEKKLETVMEVTPDNNVKLMVQVIPSTQLNEDELMDEMGGFDAD